MVVPYVSPESNVELVSNTSLYRIDREPNNINTLINNDFVFKIHRAPHVSYFCQSVSIPGITLPAMQMPTPHAVIPIEANRPIYDNLSISFKIDEYMINYMEIVNWMRGLGKPKGFQDFVHRFGANNHPAAPFMENTHPYKYSDVSLFVQTSIKNALIEVVFRDAWPVAISQIPLDTTPQDATDVQATVFFAYTYFDILRVDGTDTRNY